MQYLETKIAESKRTASPRYRLTVDGYTVKTGAPSSIMIRLEGEKRWRRVMILLFSNVGTAFVRIKGEMFIVLNHMIPEKTKIEEEN